MKLVTLFVCRAFLVSIGLIIASQPLANAAEPAAEWPQFLGPNRNGVSVETGLVDSFPESGPKIAWRAKGGVGMAGLAISRGKLVTMAQREGKQRLIALNASTGKPLWDIPIAPAYKNQMGDGPRATPAIAGDRVFTYTGEGILAAVSLTDGKLLWAREVLDELKVKVADYGTACSPLVLGDQVMVIAGAPNATVAAFDLQSGKPLWQTGTDAAGYSSLSLLNVGGQEQIVAFAAGSVMGLLPGKGTLLWNFPYETDFGCNIAMPVAYKGQVFLSAGENHGSALLALKKQGAKFNAEPVWESQGPKSVLRNEWQTSILDGDHLYGFDNVGGAGPVSHLTCINAATGERVWQKQRFGKGNMIAADGKLIIVTMAGELVLAKLTATAYEELARTPVLGSTRQAPALAGGLLYLRDDKEVVCVDLRK